MRQYDIQHHNGVDTLPDFNEAVANGRREQGMVVRAALSWLGRRRRCEHVSRAARGIRHEA